MLGSGELIVLLCLALLLFGGKKLPELAKSLGVGIREFKKAVEGKEEDATTIEIKKKKTVSEIDEE